MFTEELKRAVKLKCYISLDETETETLERLSTLMNDAQAEVSHMIGVAEDYDFSKPGPARALYLNYMWYSFNDAQNEFEDNYLSDVIKCRDYYAVNGTGDNDED